MPGMNEWDADIRIDEGLATRLVRTQFPEFRESACVPFGEGFDNFALLVDGRAVFRFPRRRIAERTLANERDLLPELAPRLPLPVPRPTWRGEPTAEYPHLFTGYPLLRGRTLCGAGLGEDARDALAAPLGAFLRVLHGIPADSLPPADYPFARLRPETQRPIARKRLHELAGRDPALPLAPLERLLDAPCPEPGETPQGLLHGDLYVRHLLTEAGTLSGVIDWGDLHTDATARDLMAVWLFRPRGREEFLRAYGPVAPETLALARFRALHHALLLAGYAHDRNDADLLRETSGTFARLLAAPPPGGPKR